MMSTLNTVNNSHHTCCDEDIEHHIQCGDNGSQCPHMSSCHSSANSSLQRFNSSFNDLDLDGLEESLVDDNNTLTPQCATQLTTDDTIVDNVLTRLRAALIRESSQRSEEEIEAITAYVEAIGACRQFDANTRRRLARAFVLAEIESTNTRVLTRGERLDAFCVVACGSLRVITRDGIERFLTVGDEFGGAARTSGSGSGGGEDGVVGGSDEELSVGAEMWTNDDFVWVLCVPHALFDDIVVCDQTIPFKTVCDDNGHVIEVRNNHNQLMRATKTRLTRLLFECVAREGGVGGGGGGPPSPTMTGVNTCDTDATFIDDYLLTFRAWQPLNTCESDDNSSDDVVVDNSANNTCEPTVQLMTRIVDTMTSQHERTGCVRLVLQWIESHFQDFTSNVMMTSLLRRFEDQLKGHVSSFRSEFKLHLKLYYLALSAKSRDRRVTLNRNNSEDAPPFTVIGGYESHSALFVDHVNEDDVTYGVTRGDRLIQINGIDVTNHVTITRANQLLTSSSVVSLVVRFDPSAYYSLKQILNENKDKQRLNRSQQHVTTQSSDHILLSTSPSHSLTRSEVSLQPNGMSSSSPQHHSSSSSSSSRVHHKWSSLQALNSLMNRILPKALNSVTTLSLQHASQVVSLASSASASQLLLFDTVDSARHHNTSNSNTTTMNSSTSGAAHRFPVTSFGHNSDSKVEVLKVYYEKEFRFLVIRRETTAREVVQLALREFSLNNTNYSSRDFALYEIQATPRSTSPNTSSSGGVTSSASSCTPSHVSAVRRLADSASDLVTNLSLNSRVYLKPITQTASVAHSDTIAKEIAHENPQLSLLSLDGASVAMEMTRRDFAVFASIESQQFVYDVTGDITCGERTRELSRFECLSNEEMFWTIDECLRYRTSIAKRVKTIKQFIKIACVCRALNNYNTMFAILSGLQHVTVSRLRQTWDRVPHKHQKQLKALQALLDPSRNMCHYRHELSGKHAPAIPFFPLVKKDIAFVHLANESVLALSGSTSGDTCDTNTTSGGARRPLLINWDKMRLLSQKIRQSVSFAENAHLLEHAFVQYAFGGNASSSSSSTTPPVIAVTQKKLWDHSVMTKRVQRYLSDTFQNVSTDEQAFMSRSMDCEAPPPLASASSSGALERRSHTSSTCSAQSSPTPSMASSCSTATSSSFGGTSAATFRARFGAQSPQQLRKLLALSSSSHPLMTSSNNSDHTCHHHNTHHNSHSHHNSHQTHATTHSLHHTCHTSLQSLSHSSHSSSPLVPSFPTGMTTLSSQLITCHACHQSPQSSAHVSSNARVVTSLPVESSSVTSLRRLEQLQQLSRFRDQWRRPLPDYQQTMERRLRQTSDSRIHVQMSPNATQSVQTSSSSEVSSKVTSEHVV